MTGTDMPPRKWGVNAVLALIGGCTTLVAQFKADRDAMVLLTAIWQILVGSAVVYAFVGLMSLAGP